MDINTATTATLIDELDDERFASRFRRSAARVSRWIGRKVTSPIVEPRDGLRLPAFVPADLQPIQPPVLPGASIGWTNGESKVNNPRFARGIERAGWVGQGHVDRFAPLPCELDEDRTVDGVWWTAPRPSKLRREIFA